MTEQPCITCREVAEFIADYLDRTLPHGMLHEFERHLSVCPSCVAYIESYKQTIRMGKAAMSVENAAAGCVAPEAVLNAIRAARKATT